jgi:hypothetical protein
MTVGGTNWQLYSAGTAPSYFAGSVNIAATPDATRAAVVNGNIRGQDQANQVASTGFAGGTSTNTRIIFQAENATVWTPAGSTDAALTGFRSSPKISATGTTFSSVVSGFESYPQIVSSDAGARITVRAFRTYTLRNQAADTSTYASNSLNGTQAVVGHYAGPSGSIVTGTANAIDANITNFNGTITTASSLESTCTVGAAGQNPNPVIGTYYALKLGAPSLANGGTITNEWGIYQQSTTASNLFAGYSLFSKANGLAIRDTSAAYDVQFGATSSTALTASRALTFDVVNSARTLKISGNATVSQDYSPAGSPTFKAVYAAPSGYPSYCGLASNAGTILGNNVISTTGNNVKRPINDAAYGAFILVNNYGFEFHNITSVAYNTDTAYTTGKMFGVDMSGNGTLAGSLTTAAPTGGTAAAWKLGTKATVSPTSPNRTIEVEVGGTTLYIAAKTTND